MTPDQMEALTTEIFRKHYGFCPVVDGSPKLAGELHRNEKAEAMVRLADMGMVQKQIAHVFDMTQSGVSSAILRERARQATS